MAFSFQIVEVKASLINGNDRHARAAAGVGVTVPSRLMTAGATTPQILQQAMAHHQAGQLAAAEALYRQILSIQPNHPDALHLLGALALDTGHTQAAYELIRQAVAIDPGSAVYLSNLGLAQYRLGRPEQAIASLRNAIQLGGGKLPDAYFHLGNVLRDLGEPEQSREAFERAISLRPGNRLAMNNLANVLHLLGKLDEAIAMHRKVLSIQPGWALARYNYGTTLLFKGDFKSGWAEYEHRLAAPELGLPQFDFRRPRWDGSSIRGKRLLLYSDQGFGDAFFALRYISMLASQGPKEIILFCQPELARIGAGVPGVSRVITQIDDQREFDFYCALMSLPHLLGTTLDSIPAAVPYIQPEIATVEAWKQQLGQLHGRKIGIAWQGRAYPRGRSIPFELLASELLGKVDATFVSLQKGVKISSYDRLVDPTDAISDFADSAAILANLDLLITIDTAIAHLAGAMGKPVWLLLQKVPDWRWMLGRKDSPWYPSTRIFRQNTPGDWSALLGQVAAEL